MSLNTQDYTLKNALLWGNCIAHCKAATEGNWHNRTVHLIIAAAEASPITGQITSLGEWALFRLFSEETFFDAVSKCNISIVKEGLNRGISIKAKDPIYHETALVIAVKRGDAEITQLLLNWGADIEAKSYFGYTPLMLAAMHGKVEIAKILLENGASTTAQKDALSSLDQAIFKEQPQIVRLLLEYGVNIEEKDINGETHLMDAAALGEFKITKIFLDYGANINAQNNQGCTALMEACSERKAKIVKLLLERGASTKISDINGKTVLQYAADFPEILKLLNKNIDHLFN